MYLSRLLPRILFRHLRRGCHTTVIQTVILVSYILSYKRHTLVIQIKWRYAIIESLMDLFGTGRGFESPWVHSQIPISNNDKRKGRLAWYHRKKHRKSTLAALLSRP